MTKQLYYPLANKTAQDFSRTSYFQNREMPRLDGCILHTTEGSSWPGYHNGADAPQLTFHPKLLQWRQHCPINWAGRALVDSPGGVSTNRNHVVQIEIIGTSGWASTENPNRSYTLDDSWKSENLSQEALKALGSFALWLNKEWGVPLTSPVTFSSWRGAKRMSSDQWDSFVGWAGHQHVPENAHTDPGKVNISAILAYAKSTTPTPNPTPTPNNNGGFLMALSDAQQEQMFNRIMGGIPSGSSEGRVNPDGSPARILDSGDGDYLRTVIEAQTAAIRALSVSFGLDPKLIEEIIREAVEHSLANLRIVKQDQN